MNKTEQLRLVKSLPTITSNAAADLRNHEANDIVTAITVFTCDLMAYGFKPETLGESLFLTTASSGGRFIFEAHNRGNL